MNDKWLIVPCFLCAFGKYHNQYLLKSQSTEAWRDFQAWQPAKERGAATIIPASHEQEGAALHDRSQFIIHRSKFKSVLRI